MQGKNVRISKSRHKKLKFASTVMEGDMGDIVDELIDEMEVPGWKEVEEKGVA